VRKSFDDKDQGADASLRHSLLSSVECLSWDCHMLGEKGLQAYRTGLFRAQWQWVSGVRWDYFTIGCDSELLLAE